STTFIPKYDTTLKPDESQMATGYTNYLSKDLDIGGLGVWTKYMPTTGGRDDIGHFTAQQMQWLITGDWRMKQVALTQADLAGSWPMQLRERHTSTFDAGGAYDGVGRFLSPKNYPNFWLYDNNGTWYNSTTLGRARLQGPDGSGNGWSND